MVIDLTPVIREILNTLSIVYFFFSEVLIFRIGNYTFSLLNWTVAAFFLAASLAAVFPVGYDGDEPID